MTRLEHERYMRSRKWILRSKEVVAAAGGRCVACNIPGPGLQAHHRTYENLGDEQPGDLTCLCRTCHRVFHMLPHAPRLSFTYGPDPPPPVRAPKPPRPERPAERIKIPKAPKPPPGPRFSYAAWKAQQLRERASLVP